MLWLLVSRIGEVFNNLKYYNRRLRAWAFIEGFNIIRNKGGTCYEPSPGSPGKVCRAGALA
jgi:hypothetical protein